MTQLKLPDLSREKRLWRNGYYCIGGVDEVGVGAIAGPIVIGIVVGNQDFNHIEGIKDSKRLSKKRIKELAARIKNNCMDYSIGSVSNEYIDEHGVREAMAFAFREAYTNLKACDLDYLLIDGKFVFDEIKVQQRAVVKGDACCKSIAAASIIAKYSRDLYMSTIVHKEFPEYGFDTNVGYYTNQHKEAVKKHGLCRYHRQSYNFKRE